METKKLFRIKSKSYFLLSIFLMTFGCLILQSCSKDDDTGENDVEAPSIYILTPTSEDVFVTTEGNITITGTAQDNVKLKTINYSSSSGNNGIADGLDSWSISNLTLIEGDNQIKVTAIDANNNQNEAKITITKNKYLTFLGIPFVSNDVFFTNEPTEVWITTSIASNEKLIASSVKLIEVDANNQYVTDVCSLYDNGNLQNGDEIKGDNVFSVKHTFNFLNETNKRYRISAKTLETTGEVEGFSATFVLTAIGQQKAEQQIESLMNVQQQIEVKLSNLLSQGLTTKDIETQLINWIPTISGVKNTSKDDGWIKITHSSELVSYVIVNEPDFRGGSPENQAEEKRRTAPQIPLNQQTRGIFNNNNGQTMALRSYSSIDNNIIQNKNVLIWAPFANDGVPAMISTPFNNNDNNSPINFNVKYILDTNCDISSLLDITNYGIIVFDTHGAGGDLILTRQNAGPVNSLEKIFFNKLVSSEYQLVTMRSKTYYAITSKFIKNSLVGKFPNSVIFNASCESLKTNLLANAFISKGAKTYLGFTQNVTNGMCIDKESEFFSTLVGADLKTTGQSFIQDGIYEMRGSTEMRFYLGLINGDFEYENLNGWNVDGDGRVITQLEHQKPTQPYYMGIVSTGLGYTVNHGSIHQTFKVTNENTLSLKWNFLSEEFMEYVGSKYQDYLKISITEGNSTETLFYKAIDNFAQQYNLTLVSPTIVFDRGGVYMTGWQTSSFDISKYKGKTITLSIATGDIGDSIYDSATLLDEIRIY